MRGGGKVAGLIGGGGTSGWHADHDYFTACGQVVWRCGIDARCSYGDKNRIRAATEGCFGILPRGGIAGQDSMCGAEFHCDVEFFRQHIYGHNPTGASDASALDGVETNTAGADDHRVLTRPHLRGIDHGPHARDHPAGNQRCDVHGDILGDFHHLGLGHNDAFSEGATGHGLV